MREKKIAHGNIWGNVYLYYLDSFMVCMYVKKTYSKKTNIAMQDVPKRANRVETVQMGKRLYKHLVLM